MAIADDTPGVSTVTTAPPRSRASLLRRGRKDVLVGLLGGAIVSATAALGSLIPDALNTTLLGGIATNTFLTEWWTLLGVALVCIGVIAGGLMLPFMLLRGARVRHFVVAILVECVVIGAVLAIVTNVVSAPQENNGECPGDICNGGNCSPQLDLNTGNTSSCL